MKKFSSPEVRCERPCHFDWIDDLKGLGIFLIVGGHCLATIMNMTEGGAKTVVESLFDAVYLFHVPLFFALAGFTFSVKDKSFRVFFLKKFGRLMLPYYVWGGVGALLYAIVGTQVAATVSEVATTTAFADKTLAGAWYTPFLSILHGGGWPNGKGFCFNGVLWFLPVLFTMELMAYCIVKYCTTICSAFVFLCVSCTILLNCHFLMYGELSVQLPFNLQLNIGYMPYFAFGYFLRKLISSTPCSMAKGLCTQGGAVLAVLILCCLPVCLFHADKTMWWFKRLISAICIISLLLLLARLRWFRMFAVLSSSTLGIMLFHKYPLVVMQILIGKAKLSLINASWFAVVLCLVLSVLLTWMCYFASKLVLRFAPWTLGFRKGCSSC